MSIQHGLPGEAQLFGDPELAQRIYQDLLDRIGEAIHADDFGRYQSFIVLPHITETHESRLIIDTRDRLEKLFNDMRDHMQRSAVAELSRYCSLAEFVAEDVIQGCHETRAMSADFILLDSYMALSHLLKTPQGWKVSRSQYAGSEKSLPASCFRPRGNEG